MISRALLNAPFFIPKDADLLRNRKVNTKKRQNRHLPELAFLFILGTYFTAPFSNFVRNLRTTICKKSINTLRQIMDRIFHKTDCATLTIFWGMYSLAKVTTWLRCIRVTPQYPIQWSVDSLDWKNYGVDSIITTVCNHKALHREPLSSVTMEQNFPVGSTTASLHPVRKCRIPAKYNLTGDWRLGSEAVLSFCRIHAVIPSA